MAKMTMKKFERSSKDKEPKGMKEGSKSEKMMDAKMMKGMKMPAKKGKK